MSEFAFDVSIDNFQEKVGEACMQTPIVIDFWATWCQPCQILKPLLENLAEVYAGRFLLAKVNADENPEIAQHFGVRSIPSVKVLYQGQLVDEFNGALPESELRAFLDRIALPAPEPVEEDESAVEAAANQATLDAAAKFADQAGDIQALSATLAANPDDHAARLALSGALAAQGAFRDALESALVVISRDRTFNDGAARKAMLAIFDALAGSEHHDDLVREFRRKLSAALN